MNTADFLRVHDIQPSFQRIRIYEVLAATRSHPSADDIHVALEGEIPTLSRTTVYNTLDLFARSGLVRKLTVSERELRFDADISPHAHFRCRVCGSVSDLTGVWIPARPSLPSGFVAESIHVYVEGLCGDCGFPDPVP